MQITIQGIRTQEGTITIFLNGDKLEPPGELAFKYGESCPEQVVLTLAITRKLGMNNREQARYCEVISRQLKLLDPLQDFNEEWDLDKLLEEYRNRTRSDDSGIALIG